MFGNAVRLTDVGPRDGLIRGECGRFRWEVRRTRGPVSYGLDPSTLYKGAGCIARLILYEPITGSGAWRKAAAFNGGWLFGRKEYITTIRRVVTYLDSR
jgi:hypothetical protein